MSGIAVNRRILAALATVGVVVTLVGVTGARGESAAPKTSAAAAGPFTLFLDLPNVLGDSTSQGYQNQIEATAYSWKVERTATNRTVFSLLSVTKGLDRATPRLFSATARATSFATARLNVVRVADGQAQPVLTYQMSSVQVTSVRHTGGSQFEETMTLRFPAAQLTYTTYNEDGSAGTPIVCSYDTRTQQGNPC